MPPPTPPRPVGPVAGKGLRAAARALDGIIELCLCIGVLIVAGERYRIWGDVFLVWLAIAAYEGLSTAWFGASPGKRIVGVRVVELDRPGRPTMRAAIRRAAISGVLVLVLPVGLLVALAAIGARAGGVSIAALIVSLVAFGGWPASVLGDPLGRGVADRSGPTMVIAERFGGIVSTNDLPGFADAVRPPRMTPRGRIADADVRVRARLRRLDDAPVLAGAIGLLALAASVPVAGDDTSPRTQLLVIVATSLAWIVVFVAHEARLIARQGATPGHRLAGLCVVDRRTGTPPRGGRSFGRALALGLTMYVPLLWPLLAVSLLTMRYSDQGRGLHDLVGGTLVVSDPSLAPEEQRQRTMRMRLGRAG